MKQILFSLGVVLAVAAFLATAGELAARALNPDLPVLPGLDAVWRTLSPDTWEATLVLVENTQLLGVLGLPGWLVLGVPGLALIVAFRERGEGPDQDEYEESLFLFDELAKRAREEGYDDLGDDIAPSDHADMDLADARFASDDILDDLLDDEDVEHDTPPSSENANAPDAPDSEPNREKP